MIFGATALTYAQVQMRSRITRSSDSNLNNADLKRHDKPSLMSMSSNFTHHLLKPVGAWRMAEFEFCTLAAAASPESISILSNDSM